MGDPLECAVEAEDRGLGKCALFTELRKTGKWSIRMCMSFHWHPFHLCWTALGGWCILWFFATTGS